MKNNKKLKIPFVLFLIVSLTVCTLATIFSVKDIQHSSYLERSKSLNLVMNKIGDHLNIAFETKWNKLHFLTKRIERLNASSIDDLICVLDDIYMETGMDFKVVDDKGIAYYHDGMQEYWKDHRAVLPKKETFILSPLQFGVSNENYMKYIVPLKKPLIIGDVVIAYTVLTEPLSALRRDFDTGNYGEGCLSFIIDKRGTFIYENGSDDLMADSYNFFAYTEKTVNFLYGESFESFRNNIEKGICNTVLVEYNGIRYYLSHFDLDMENWTSIMMVPEHNIQAESKSFTQKLLGNIAVVFGTASLIFIFGFLYMWKKTVTKQRHAAEAEKRSNEAKTNFLSSMSHDIRTPMNAIIGMTEIALHNKNDIPKPVQENLEKIRLSSAHLLMLINDILDISKIESGKMSLNVAEFSIVESTNTLTNLLRPLAKEKGIDLRIHTYNYFQEYIFGDELRISQVCINLATNAIKYTQRGGSVVIDFKQEQIEDMPDKVRMTVTVRDTGIGMDEKYQKHMYEVFSRATDSRVNKVSGSGLGLPICKNMLELMGGTLDCESTLGKGTKFIATIVLDKGKPDEKYALEKMRVLVVDRDMVSTVALKRIFKMLNVESDVINDFSMINELLTQKKSYKVAFVELGAPQNEGISIVEALRGHFGEDFPIILTDIADMTEYSEQISEAGIELTMNKPYYYRVVYQTIRKALQASDCCADEPNSRKENSICGMKVLVAEDNDLNWGILNELLRINGATAWRAENGSECVDMLNKAEEGQYEAVLMDVRMPIMNGLEATCIIRKSKKKWLKEIPIIAMTADAFAEDIQHCVEAGMNGHLAKPVNLDRLLSVLSDIQSGIEPKFFGKK